MGRAKTIPKDQYVRVAKLAGYGMTNVQIASIYEMSHTTFEKLLKEDEELASAMKAGKEQLNEMVINSAFEQAVSGKVPAMTMFWLKCRAGWKENNQLNITGSVTLESLIKKSIEDEKKEDAIEVEKTIEAEKIIPKQLE